MFIPVLILLCTSVFSDCVHSYYAIAVYICEIFRLCSFQSWYCWVNMYIFRLCSFPSGYWCVHLYFSDCIYSHLDIDVYIYDWSHLCHHSSHHIIQINWYHARTTQGKPYHSCRMLPPFCTHADFWGKEDCIWPFPYINDFRRLCSRFLL